MYLFFMGYSAMLSISKDYTVTKWRDKQQIMYWKGYRRSRGLLFYDTPTFAWRSCMKPRVISVRIGILAEIQTGHLAVTSVTP